MYSRNTFYSYNFLWHINTRRLNIRTFIHVHTHASTPMATKLHNGIHNALITSSQTSTGHRATDATTVGTPGVLRAITAPRETDGQRHRS